MKTKLFYYLTDNLLKHEDRILDLAREHDLYIFTNEIFNLLNNNATSIVVNHRMLNNNKIKIIDNIKTIATKMNTTLSVIYELPKIRFFVADMFNFKFNVSQDQVFYIFYDKKNVEFLPQNSILLSCDLIDKSVFKDVKIDTYISLINKKTKFKIQNNNLDECYLEVKSMNDVLIEDEDEMVIDNITLKNDFLFNEELVEDIIHNIKKIGVNALLIRNDLTTFDLLKLKEILFQNDLSSIKILASIETKNALNNIKELIVNADGIIFNNQYLCNYEQEYALPFWQNYCTKACRVVNKPILIQNRLDSNLQDFDVLNSIYNTILNSPDAINYCKNYSSLPDLANKIAYLNVIIEEFEKNINLINSSLILENSVARNNSYFLDLNKIFNYFSSFSNLQNILFCFLSDDLNFINSIISCRMFNIVTFVNNSDSFLQSYQYGLNIINYNNEHQDDLLVKDNLTNYLNKLDYHFKDDMEVYVCYKDKTTESYIFKKVN